MPKLRHAFAVSLLCAAATGAHAADPAPLPSGKPAGAKQAALLASGPVLIGIGMAIAGIVIVASAGSSNSTTTTTSTAASP